MRNIFSLIKPEIFFDPIEKVFRHYFLFPVIIVTDIIFIKFLKPVLFLQEFSVLFDVEFDLTFLEI